MKNWKLLDTLINSSDLQFIDMKKGLTNTNYLLKTKEDAYVLRVPRSDSANIVHRHHETLALEAIKDSHIDVEMLYYDESSGYKLTRYVENAMTYQECPDENKIEQVAALMKKFHNLNKQIHVSFDPVKRLESYMQHIQDPIYDLSPYMYLKDRIKNHPHKTCLCHNDWVDGNILFTKENVYLIDYEYAADNDPLFDVMSFLSENKIFDEEERKRFYTIYFEGKEVPYKELHLWETFMNILWCAWAMMMWESRKEDVYKQIAEDKYHALLVCLKSHI